MTDDPNAEAPTAEQAPIDAPAAPPATPVPPYATAVSPPSPFTPVVKEPWINPAKRTKLTVGGIIAALLLLGAGFVAGAATGGRDHRNERFGPAMRMGNDKFGWVPARNRDGISRLNPNVGYGTPPGYGNGPGVPSLPSISSSTPSGSPISTKTS